MTVTEFPNVWVLVLADATDISAVTVYVVLYSRFVEEFTVVLPFFHTMFPIDKLFLFVSLLLISIVGCGVPPTGAAEMVNPTLVI